MSSDLPFGFLRTCIDKRFVAATRRKFEETTGLASDQYWHEAYAGGAARDPSLVANNPETGNNVYADQYAYGEGARIFGWQAHIDKCGGLPGADDAAISTALDQHIDALIREYPDSQHYRIVASGEKNTLPVIHIQKVWPVEVSHHT